MKRVLYTSPFIPPEWIAAHGLVPERLTPAAAAGERSGLPAAGTCPFVRAFAGAVIAAEPETPAVFATTCDQQRRAAEFAAAAGRPVFLFNVPASWQSPAAPRLYRAELERLGRFLAGRGGAAPAKEKLAAVLREHDDRRRQRRDTGRPAAGKDEIPLALVGGPLLAEEQVIFELVAAAGGAIVLDASEQGERGEPGPFDRRELGRDPLGELVRVYFGGLPDAFRRPNDLLFRWLGAKLKERGVRGIVFHAGPWCDPWLAELRRLRDWAPAPLAAIGLVNDEGAAESAAGRLQAFLETLRR